MSTIESFHHVHLISSDPVKTSKWYIDFLGADLTHEEKKHGAINIRLQIGNLNLFVRGLRENEELSTTQNLSQEGIHHIGLMVDDIKEIMKRTTENGATEIEEIHTGVTGNWVAFIRTPEGVLIEFLQKK